MNKAKHYLPALLFTICGVLFYGCASYRHIDDSSVSYYVDAEQGDDNNSGLSKDKAWKTIDKINKQQLLAGNRLLLKRGCVFIGVMNICAQGSPYKRIIIDAYGKGDKPRVSAPDSSLYAVSIRNSDYVTLQNIEIMNKGTRRMAERTGVKVSCDNYGISHNIILNALDIHDVNGSLVKKKGGGSAIFIENRYDSIVSVFDSLTIENCVIRRCERNAMIWSAPWSRKRNWHLSTNTVVRNNLIEEVPGDGIVPIGCDGALIEYNLMRNCTALLPEEEAAAGIWPWSCDNTVIQFNEVSQHKAPWDGQGFDSDYNCTNTTIQYNYSHDNDGGFLLICNAGKGETDSADNIGNIGSIVRYNVSVNDGIRQRLTRVGIFSPAIHISGPCKNTLVENNILHADKKPTDLVDRKMISSGSWGGYADSTIIKGNVFFAGQPSAFDMTKSTNNTFIGNYYLGSFTNMPDDNSGRNASTYYNKVTAKGISKLFKDVKVGDGAATMKVVKTKTIERFFKKMANE